MNKAKIKRASALLLAVLLLCLSIPTDIFADGEILTIYIDNSVWYRCKLCPLIIKDGVYCVPVSVFDGYDLIDFSYNKEYDTYIFEKDEAFLSVKPSGSSFSSDGSRKDITFFDENGELYISAEDVAGIFGLLVECGNYYGTEVIRISKTSSETSLKSLVDFSKSMVFISSGDSFDIVEPPSHKSTASVVIDLTGTDFDTAFSVASAIETASVPVTALVDRDFLRNTAASAVVLRLLAKECSFAIKAHGNVEEADFCSKYMYDVFGETTMLVVGDSAAFAGTAYTIIDISGAEDVSEFDPGRDIGGKNIILRLDISVADISETLKSLAISAEENYILLYPLNRVTGK